MEEGQPQEAEKLMSSPGVLSAGVAAETLTSQGDAIACTNPFHRGEHRRGPGACVGLPGPSTTMIYISTALDPALIPWGRSCPSCPPCLCLEKVRESLGKAADPSKDTGAVAEAVCGIVPMGASHLSPVQ